MTVAMPRSCFAPDIAGNQLIGSLEPPDRAVLLPHLERVELGQGDVLIDRDHPIKYLYFPCRATMVQLSIGMIDGRAAQTAVVTNLGVVGLIEALGDGCGVTRAEVAIGGPALRIGDAALRQAMQRSSGLRTMIARDTEALVGQLAQNAACNAVHSVDRRVARWLLTAHDCCVQQAADLHANDIFLPIKQEALGEALGVQRTTVTLAAKRLQEAGCIRYSRGRIRVSDRAALEDAACECHRQLWHLWRRLLPGAIEDWRPD